MVSEAEWVGRRGRGSVGSRFDPGDVWDSLHGTALLYGAAAVHFVIALWAIYERRTFRLPQAELLRIAMGFTLPLILINHFANTRLAYEIFGMMVAKRGRTWMRFDRQCDWLHRFRVRDRGEMAQTA